MKAGDGRRRVESAARRLLDASVSVCVVCLALVALLLVLALLLLPLLAASAVATFAVCAVVGTEWSWGLAVATWLIVCMGLLAIGVLEDVEGEGH